jgi:hypothetical protein
MLIKLAKGPSDRQKRQIRSEPRDKVPVSEFKTAENVIDSDVDKDTIPSHQIHTNISRPSHQPPLSGVQRSTTARQPKSSQQSRPRSSIRDHSGHNESSMHSGFTPGGVSSIRKRFATIPNRTGGLAPKRRATSPTASNANRKRPKTVGPFIDDSDDSDGSEEDSDQQIESSHEDDNSIKDDGHGGDHEEEGYGRPRPVRSSIQQPPPNHFKPSPNSKPTPQPISCVRLESRNPRIHVELQTNTAKHLPANSRKTVLDSHFKSTSTIQAPPNHPKAPIGPPVLKSTKPINMAKLWKLLKKGGGANSTSPSGALKGQATATPPLHSNQKQGPARTDKDLISTSLEILNRGASLTQPISRSNDHVGQSKMQVKATRTPAASRVGSEREDVTASPRKKTTSTLNASRQSTVNADTSIASHSPSSSGKSAPTTAFSTTVGLSRNLTQSRCDTAIGTKQLSGKATLSKDKQNSASVQRPNSGILGGLIQDIRLGGRGERVTNHEPTSNSDQTRAAGRNRYNYGRTQTVESDSQDRPAQRIQSEQSTAPPRKQTMADRQTPESTAQNARSTSPTLFKFRQRQEASQNLPSIQKKPAGSIASGSTEATRPGKRQVATPPHPTSMEAHKKPKLIGRKPSLTNITSNTTISSLVSPAPGVPSSSMMSEAQSSSLAAAGNGLKPKSLMNCDQDQQSKTPEQLSQIKVTVVKKQDHESKPRQSSVAVNTKPAGIQSPPTATEAARKTFATVGTPAKKAYAAPTAVMVASTTGGPSETMLRQGAKQSNPKVSPTNAAATLLKMTSKISQEPDIAIPGQDITLESAKDQARTAQPVPITFAVEADPQKASTKRPLITKLQEASSSTAPTTPSINAPPSIGVTNANPDMQPKTIELVRTSDENVARRKVQLYAHQKQNKEEEKTSKVANKPGDAEADRKAKLAPDTLKPIAMPSLKIGSPREPVSKTTSQIMSSSKVASIPSGQQADATLTSPAPVLVLSISPTLPANAVPYFEYSIFQKIWSEPHSEASAVATEFPSRPYTNVDAANTQAETFFKNTREQYHSFFQVKFGEWFSRVDDHGCEVLTGTFKPIDNPSKKSWVKIWVQRDCVSVYAGGTEKDMKHTSFVAKTVYTMRLFELVDPNSEDQTDDATSTRVYHPLPRTECYTTLGAANQAAKSLQIELSHEKSENAMTRVWQADEAAKLDKKLSDLETAQNEEAQYWRSKFNGYGLGSKRFELLVEKVGLCGPRNL